MIIEQYSALFVFNNSKDNECYGSKNVTTKGVIIAAEQTRLLRLG